MMRLLFLLLLLFYWQPSLALPRASADQCTAWAAKIEQFNDKRRQGASLKKMEYYRARVEEYREKRRLGRCRARQNS